MLREEVHFIIGKFGEPPLTELNPDLVDRSPILGASDEVHTLSGHLLRQK